MLNRQEMVKYLASKSRRLLPPLGSKVPGEELFAVRYRERKM